MTDVITAGLMHEGEAPGSDLRAILSRFATALLPIWGEFGGGSRGAFLGWLDGLIELRVVKKAYLAALE